jgi:hypothetical protein
MGMQRKGFITMMIITGMEISDKILIFLSNVPLHSNAFHNRE